MYLCNRFKTLLLYHISMNNIKNIKAKVLRVDEEEHKFVIEVEDRIYKVAQVDFQRRRTRYRKRSTA